MPLHLAETPPDGFADAIPLNTPGLQTLPPGEPIPASPDTAGPIALPGPASRSQMPSLAAFPGRVGRDLVHLVVRPVEFDQQDWTRLALGAGVVGAVALFDNRIRNSVVGTGSGTTALSVRPIGTWGGVAVMGAALAAGGVFHDSNLASMGLDGIEASLFSALLITPVLKHIAGRPRPNAGQGASDLEPLSANQSFPSGEVTLAFTNAAVIAAHTDSPVIRGVAWGLAGLVGWERMRLDAHWASDVVAGALIGTAVGSWVVKIHEPEETGTRTTVSVLPLVGPRAVGLTASISW
jgi:membrane-associated phospholipid phosphatase